MNCLALLMVLSSFRRLRMMPSYCISRSMSCGVICATFSTSKWWKALRYPSRLRRMVIQESPACALSSTRNSKRVLSSVTGRPHSSSWYLVYRGSVPAQPQREFMMSCMCLLFGSKSQSRFSEMGNCIPVIFALSSGLFSRFRSSDSRLSSS